MEVPHSGEEVLTKKQMLELEAREIRQNIQSALAEVATRTIRPGAHWWDLSLCSAEAIDPEIFDVEKGDRHALDIARQHCNACQVVDSCYAAALGLDTTSGSPEQHLIWASTTPEQRNKIYKDAVTRRRRQHRP